MILDLGDTSARLLEGWLRAGRTKGETVASVWAGSLGRFQRIGVSGSLRFRDRGSPRSG